VQATVYTDPSSPYFGYREDAARNVSGCHTYISA
jgi:hypothetical protein